MGDDWRTGNAGKVLSNALRRFEERVMLLMADSGYTQTRRSHVNLTRHLDLGGTRITELARRAAMTSAAMTELIDQCTHLGLVERIEDVSDKRARIVRFTPEGRKWLNAFGKAVARAQAELESEIGKRNLSALLSGLRSYGENGDAQ